MFAKSRNVLDLNKECGRLRKKGDSASKRQLAKSLTELALSYQKKGFSHVDIISTATEALCIFEEVTANYDCITRLHRVLAEVLAEDKDREKDALEHAGLYLKTAEESGDHAQIQLAFHVNAWVREKIWTVSGKKPSECRGLLNEALQWCEKAIAYIKDHGRQFTKDAVLEAGSADDRKANVERLASGLAGTLEKKELANKYWKSAWNFASNKSAKGEKQTELQFELLMTQLDWSWVDKIQVAGKLVDIAPAKKKGIALFEQSQVLIYEGLFTRAYNKLLESYGQHAKGLSEDEKVILQNRLIYAYKVHQTIERLDTAATKKEKRRACEVLGDTILSYEAENPKILRLALAYYQQMLSFSATTEEKIAAYVSVASTFSDLKSYDRAVTNYEECLECERKSGKPAAKLLGTRICIFDCKSKGRMLTKEQLEEEFQSLDNDLPDTMPSLKEDLYTYMAEAMESFGDHRAKEYKRKAESWKGRIRDAEDEDQSQEASNEAEEEESDSQILRKCERQIKRNNDEEYIKKRINTRNSHGETDLHEAARGNDPNHLLRLLQAKYRVNAQDHGGWTPLHEAVSHGKVEHVKILLKAGANVELASREGFDNDKAGGGITPLLDVLADMGSHGKFVLTSLNIAKAIFAHKPMQVVKKYDHGWEPIMDAYEWTAVDMLSAAIDRFDEHDRVHLPMAKVLLHDMKQIMLKVGIPLRDGPPPPKPTEVPREFKDRHKKQSRAPPRTPGVSDLKGCLNHLRRRPVGDDDFDDVMDVDDDDKDIFDDPGSPLRQDRSPQHQATYQSESEDIPSERQETPPPRSTPRQRSSTQFSARNAADDFIEDDIGASRKSSKKRKSTEVHSQRPKRMNRSNSWERNETYHEDDMGFGQENLSPPVSPDLVRIRPEKRRSSTQTPPAAEPAPKTTAVHLFFVIPEAGSSIDPTLLQLPGSSTVADLHDRCVSKLPLQYRNFGIFYRNSELDEEFSLSNLKTNKEEDNCCGFPHLNCEVKKALPVDLFKGYDPAYTTEKAVLEQLDKLSVSGGALDVSRIEVDFCIQNILRSVHESAARLKMLNISTCDILETNCTALAHILQRCEEFIAHAVNMNDQYVDQLVAIGLTFPSLTALDVSNNNISGKGLLKLLGMMPSLNKVTIRGLDLTDAGVEVADSLKGLTLTYLNIQNTRMDPSALEAVFSECDKLKSIFVGGLDLEMTFSASWLPRLRHFVAPGCKILHWTSFLDWVSLISPLERIDLSCTNITTDHVMELCERLGSDRDSRPLTMRLVRCPGIERYPRELQHLMLRFMEERHNIPLRLQLAQDVDRDLRQGTAHATQFLAGSF